MAAKSIINELYQRLRTAAPIYKTQADEVDGFLCTLTLPAVECEFEALSSDRSFIGRGCSKKEAEHAAAIAGVELLTAEKVLRPDVPAGSHSRGTASASPSVSSATSGISLPGVGAKRSKSNADPLDEDPAESLELRILEALTAAYPKPLNGAQLAKLCGHFKLKSKVNHLLYMKLKAQGLVELLDTATPAWRATGKALPAGQAAAVTAQAPASAVTAATDAAACSEGDAQMCATQPGATGNGRSACAADAEAAAAGGHESSSAVLTNSRNTNDVPAAGEHAGEVSSAAGRSKLAALAPEAAGASTQQMRSSAGCVGAGAGGASKQPKQNPPASPRVASQQAGSMGTSKGGPSMSPAASSSAALARPAVSGGGVRGSSSPLPAAVYNRRQLPQQQQQAGELPSGVLYGSRVAAPAVGQSDISRYRRQHMHRPQQQQQAGLLHTVLQPGAARSHGMQQRTQQLQQQLQSDTHAVGVSAAAQQQQQQQQWQLQQQNVGRLQELAHPMGVDALLMPQTLAAVAGLGLVDVAEAAMYLSGAAGLGLRLSSAGTAQAAQQHSVSQRTQSASSFGCAHAHSYCSQEGQPRDLEGYLHGKLSGGLHQQAVGRQAAAVAAGRVGPFDQCRQGNAASDSDEEISPAVLAAVTEAASLEPAPFDAERLSGSTGSFQQQQQQLRVQQDLRQQQQGAGGLHLLQHVDLLAAMHINEQPSAHLSQQQEEGPCAQDAVVPQSAMRARVGAGGSSRAPGEGGTKRKYPAYLSTDGQAAGAADTAAADAAHAPTAAGQVEFCAQDGAMQDSQEQQLLQELLVSYQQQGQQPVADADPPYLHPQRRRRRSRQGEGFSGRGLGLAAASGADAAGRFRESSPVDGEQSCSSDDMREVEVPLQAAAADAGGLAGDLGGVPSSHQRMSDGCAAAAEELRKQQQRRQADQQGWLGLWQQGNAARCPPVVLAGAGAMGMAAVGAAAAAAAAWNGGQALGSQWPEPGTGSGGNPWQWQGQQGRKFVGTAVAAADSEGNGSCLSWPAAATGNPCQQQQQGALAGMQPQHHHQQQQQQQNACSGGFEGVRPASPVPCMSGLSVGASAVSGGAHRGSVEPSQAGAAAAAPGQEVTQPFPNVQQRTSSQWHQQQQPLDWLQSEEQALQLLSRLALPPAGGLQATAAGAQASPVAHSAADGAAGRQAVGAGVQDTAGAGIAGDCLTVAMAAAAAAAAQAAAAVASAAGLVVPEPAASAVGGQQQQAAGPPEGSTGLLSAGADAGTNRAGSTAAAAAAAPGPQPAAAGPGAERGLSQGSDSVAPAELQAEYERRVGAVRDLVQQLNEALQGLSSLQGQVGGKRPAGSNVPQQ